MLGEKSKVVALYKVVNWRFNSVRSLRRILLVPNRLIDGCSDGWSWFGRCDGSTSPSFTLALGRNLVVEIRALILTQIVEHLFEVLFRQNFRVLMQIEDEMEKKRLDIWEFNSNQVLFRKHANLITLARGELLSRSSVTIGSTILSSIKLYASDRLSSFAQTSDPSLHSWVIKASINE